MARFALSRVRNSSSRGMPCEASEPAAAAIMSGPPSDLGRDAKRHEFAEETQHLLQFLLRLAPCPAATPPTRTRPCGRGLRLTKLQAAIDIEPLRVKPRVAAWPSSPARIARSPVAGRSRSGTICSSADTYGQFSCCSSNSIVSLEGPAKHLLGDSSGLLRRRRRTGRCCSTSPGCMPAFCRGTARFDADDLIASPSRRCRSTPPAPRRRGATHDRIGSAVRD